jgi:hypothetical protein
MRPRLLPFALVILLSVFGLAFAARAQDSGGGGSVGDPASASDPSANTATSTPPSADPAPQPSDPQAGQPAPQPQETQTHELADQHFFQDFTHDFVHDEYRTWTSTLPRA